MASKLVIIVLGLTPIFFLPTTQNFYDTNKWMLITVGALLTLVFWAFTLLRHKTPIHITIPSGALGFGALTIASFIGLAAASTNKIEAIISPLGTLTFLALTILVLAASAVAKRDKVCLKWILYATTGILGLIAIYQTLGMGKLMFPGVSYLADPLWTPTGSVTSTIAVFLITLSLLIPDTIAVLAKRQEHGTLALLAISCIVIVIGTVLTLFQFIPKMTAGVLPFDVGMVVASRIFKNPTSAAVGVGVENFVSAFTASRPASLNTTALADVAFGTNADFFLHILTVYGLIGLAAAVLFVMSLFRENNTGWLFVTKSLCVACLVLISPTITLLSVIAAILILVEGDKHTPKAMTIRPWIRIPAGVLLMLVTAASFYFLIRAYTAEVYFFRSLRAARENDGTKTYNMQIRAIGANTFVSRYHITYSQTNLALANSLVSTATPSGQDQQLIAQLVQQAVRDAKTAVSLNANNVAAWENLGVTYQAIIPVATEAAGWALTAYSSAVKLDPGNPALFVNIGSVFVSQKQYDNAITAFQRAIQLNPSYANAYYNLAHTYTLKGDTVQAATTLTNTMKLVQPESTDYYKIKNELDAIQHTTP